MITCILCSARCILYTVHADPRKPSEGGSTAAAGPIGQYGVPAAYERSFKWKVGHFRNLCAVSCSCANSTYTCKHALPVE